MSWCVFDRARARARCAAALLSGVALTTSVAAQPVASEPDRDAVALRLSQAAIGRRVADWAFTDRHGRKVQLSDYRGKPLVVSFIYTGCFQVCPATTQFLKRATIAARDALGAGTFRVISIGFNQPFDGPEALAAFARKQGADLDNWDFLAPRAADVDALLAEFGLSVTPTAAGFDHLVQATVVDASGRIHAQVYGDSFALPMLINPLKEALAGETARRMTLDNVWRKVKLYCTVYDPASGRYKFDYSLFVELFAGLTTLGFLAWVIARETRRHLRSRSAPSDPS
jgi:protein SCO1/2